MDQRKTCSKCGDEKPVSEFLFRNKKEKTYHSACSLCYKEQRKQSYQRNKKYYLDKNKRLKKRNKDWFVEYKRNEKCLCCGESDIAVLDFHHTRNKIKEVSRMAYDIMSIKKLLIEIKKCVVLCSNCHRKLHYYKYTIEELKNALID